MFSKSLFAALTVLALSSFSLAAPALSCPAAATVTVASSSSSVAAVSSSVAVASSSVATTAAAASTSVASTKNNNNGKGSANNAATASFGKCSTPQIKFAAGLDGRKETSFAPADTKSFNHGSADNIDVISSFICSQLQSSCKANAAAVSTCKTASSAADAAAKGTGAQADAFNAAFGLKTNFAAVTQVGTNGKPVKASTTAKAVSTSALSTSVAGTTNVAVASTTGKDASTTTASSAASSTSAAVSGGASNSTDSGDAQSSLTLDPKVIATGFESDGQQVPTAGQVPSLTSSNNFINFCLTVPNKVITNGVQVQGGSCNPAPMGVIASTANMPSSKFTFPTNFGSVEANTAFTITMAINHLETGNFVNAASNYYAAPQQVNGAGDIIGHTHFVIEKLSALDQTTPNDPNVFAFFKGVNGAAVNGVVSVDVTDGLDAGVYRLASINAAANHQPVLVAVAQHGSLDDMVYFTVGGASNSTAATSSVAATSTAAAGSAKGSATATKAATSSAAATTAAKGGNNNNNGKNQQQNNNNNGKNQQQNNNNGKNGQFNNNDNGRGNNNFFGFGGH